MSRRPLTKFIDDRMLGEMVEQIAFKECSARAAPYLREAANRLQGRAPDPPLPSLFQRLAGALGLTG